MLASLGVRDHVAHLGAGCCLELDDGKIADKALETTDSDVDGVSSHVVDGVLYPGVHIA